MTYLAKSVCACVLSCAFISPASAEESKRLKEEMPNQYLDTVAAKLLMAGFHDIKVVDEQKNKITAYDEWGSELVILVHPSNRKIVSQSYVHGSDQ